MIPLEPKGRLGSQAVGERAQVTEAERDADLEVRLAPLRQRPSDPSLRYHALSLTAHADGPCMVGSMNTRWIGWADAKRRVELRVSDPVSIRYADKLEQCGVSWLYVVFDLDVLLFMRAGGAALVERALAEEYFPRIVEPAEAYLYGRSGFVEEGLLARGARSRRATAARRKAILARDRGRCRLCRRDPKDFIDMELEVHHIRPWAEGGTTDPTNLITLCRRCHKALKPHFDRKLFDLVEQNDGSLRKLGEQTASYRDATKRLFETL